VLQLLHRERVTAAVMGVWVAMALAVLGAILAMVVPVVFVVFRLPTGPEVAVLAVVYASVLVLVAVAAAWVC
jgi:hypothetical protein